MSDVANPTVYTIGHSTRPVETFVDMLRGVGVAMLVDVRSIPQSRTNPHYNLDTLPETLEPYQIGHVHITELGGRRPRQQEVDPALNGFWQNQSFHNYADYALSDSFALGYRYLLDHSAGQRCAIMCAEAVWWRCHRRIIADYLINDGREVVHLVGPGRSELARITPSARPREGHLIYPELPHPAGCAAESRYP